MTSDAYARVEVAVSLITARQQTLIYPYATPALRLVKAWFSSGEKVVIPPDSYPVICGRCAKQVSVCSYQAAIIRNIDHGCDRFNITHMVFNNANLEILAHAFGITSAVLDHFMALEMLKRRQQWEQQLNELSRYYVKPAISAGFESISSLS